MTSTRSTKLFTSFLSLLLVAAIGCTTKSENAVPLSDRLDMTLNREGKIDYLVDFKDKSQADAHAAEVAKRGGSVIALDSEKRVLRVQGAGADLSGVAVPLDALVSRNTVMKIVKPQAETQPVAPTVNAEQAIESFLTGRKVVGVEELLAKVPEADGRNVKVAVFDTGIDFGVRGLFKHPDGRQKLVGFYDTTDFGLIDSDPVAAELATATRFDIEGLSVEIDSTMQAQKIEAKGVVDEIRLAKDYLAGEGGIDLDQNGKMNDKFPYLLGVNKDGKPAVFIDANRDGRITDRAKEELTDFNTTFKYVDLRPEVSPSGARSLAVTIGANGRVQFHSVIGGHGTSCAIIIAGEDFANGRLRGMAPKADLVSFVLDVTGQDVYTLDQFTKMFLKAKEVKVDAISISWGFATADLASARFVSEFLDREIASAGIAIGIAAGNEGPGISTAAADDYIPRTGFGVGAHISVDQARNVYGWTGATEDSVIWYSSFGPTRGGRQIPDVVAPLMSLVRGERGIAAPQFTSFSGTSSATPAMIGATSALMSAIKAKGEKVNARLLKLAVQQTATPVKNVLEIRQGAGLVNVAAAFDVYMKLIKEMNAAEADATKSLPFAVELKAATVLENQAVKGEGIHYYSYRSSAIVDLALSEATKKQIDPLTYIESLQIVHSNTFMTTPSVVPVQANGGRFSIQFDQTKMAAPGAYTDMIKIVRPSDGLVLARIPVVVEVPAPSSMGTLLSVSQDMGPFDTLRIPVKLENAGSILLQGLVRELSGGERMFFGMHVRNRDGLVVADLLVPHSRSVEALELRTERLPAGNYEVILFRHFGRPGAVLNKINLVADLRVPFATVLSARQVGQKVEVALRAEDDLAIEMAKLNIDGRVMSATLNKQMTGVARPGFYGDIDLGKKLDKVMLRLRQSAGDQAIEGMLHMSVALVDRETGVPAYRGWNNVVIEGSPLHEVELAPPGQKFQVIAYPNIVNWDNVLTQDVMLDVGVPLEAPVSVESKVTQALAPKQTIRLLFDVADSVPENAYGSIELKDASGKVLETIKVDF